MSNKTEPLTHQQALDKFRRLDWITPLVLIVVGGFVTWQLWRPNDGPPSCDGETMGPGDACIVFGGKSYTYEEQMAENAFRDGVNSQVWPFLAAALAVLLVFMVYRGTIEPRLAKIPPPTTDEVAGHAHTGLMRPIGVAVSILLFLLGYHWLLQGLHEGGRLWPAAIPWVLAVLTLLTMSIHPRHFLRITPDEILVANGAKVRSLPWADARVVDRPDSSIRVLGPDTTLKAEASFTDSELLRPRMRERVLEAHLAPAMQHLSAGQTLDFGTLQASAAGITANEQTITWDNLSTLNADATDFTITATDGTKIEVPVKSVPNRWVLEQLAEIIVRGLREQA
ncbi:DUF6585 family protein [Enemella sp. A6]|uniref:DUF6585 family protein n=1 Tax=Enemella sp. A6 TaxID=3440152 RepID=UPI003EB9C3F8